MTVMGAGRRAATVLAVSVLVLSACGTTTEAEPSAAAYSEPGWMADARAQEETYVSAFSSCLRGLGQEVDEQTAAVRVPTDENGEPLPGAEEAAGAALTECVEQVPEPQYWHIPMDEEYERVLDVRDCVIAQGYEIPEPPSQAAWVQAAQSASEVPWSPYNFFNHPDGSSSMRLSADQARALLETCPPSGSIPVDVHDS